ncbi:hypothetical protein [Synergistes jonesii]|uniref:HTH luxR-type domain-containing protein n=1 Tax=Synergistes jonesii TaxID=2754 RepID=A0A073ITU1_9BACT|nr:hypothetical protein [Synergistes jonesii]KEJ93194.1 hypothetical protein EH55_12900 [Synergistes jonesii]OFB60696.1 hypothetical protein JS72_12005 [Synergistes jonesii]OFB64807.1 hypothetical protein JS73_02880 [Synergistes jonesii]OFB66108.1 hypothetical protein JS79_02885 [Synergistes jonesii]OFB68967.1 hypothetical protein JS78_02885 [Synergistes jonesii]
MEPIAAHRIMGDSASSGEDGRMYAHIELGPRQIQILALYAGGLTRPEIQKKLRISDKQMDIAEDKISDCFKEYDMRDCARKWKEETMKK